MKITVKLFAVLAEYLPPGVSKNQADIEVDDGATADQVLTGLGLPRERCHLVLVNGHYLAPSERPRAILRAGDHLAAWPPVAGGGP